MKNTIFWDITSCSPLKVNWNFGGIFRLNFQGREISLARNQRESRPCLPPTLTLVCCSAYSSTLKIEAKCSSELSIDFQRTTRRYIQEDSAALISKIPQILLFFFSLHGFGRLACSHSELVLKLLRILWLRFRTVHWSRKLSCSIFMKKMRSWGLS
jgi:hypothetical protein